MPGCAHPLPDASSGEARGGESSLHKQRGPIGIKPPRAGLASLNVQTPQEAAPAVPVPPPPGAPTAERVTGRRGPVPRPGGAGESGGCPQRLGAALPEPPYKPYL